MGRGEKEIFEIVDFREGGRKGDRKGFVEEMSGNKRGRDRVGGLTVREDRVRD